jgi:hypothetical protein
LLNAKLSEDKVSKMLDIIKENNLMSEVKKMIKSQYTNLNEVEVDQICQLDQENSNSMVGRAVLIIQNSQSNDIDKREVAQDFQNFLIESMKGILRNSPQEKS